MVEEVAAVVGGDVGEEEEEEVGEDLTVAAEAVEVAALVV